MASAPAAGQPSGPAANAAGSGAVAVAPRGHRDEDREASMDSDALAVEQRGRVAETREVVLPPNYSEITVSRWTLSYELGGAPVHVLNRAFRMSHAEEVLRLMQLSTLVLFIVNAVLVIHDFSVFEAGSALEKALLIRFALVMPCCILAFLLTTDCRTRCPRAPNISRLYYEQQLPLALLVVAIGGGIVAYSSISSDPGYGTLSILIVFVHSFTPLGVVVGALITASLVVTFLAVVLSIFVDTNVLSGPDIAQIFGVLILFSLAVGYIGYTVEASMRSSLLAELILAHEERVLKHEQELADRLLSSMLPVQIIQDLKHNRPVEAEMFKEVTVLFCEVDLRVSEGQLNPEIMVGFLNGIYSKFDLLIDEHQVHKVETVGEIYMVVAGCPKHDGLHAQRAARMALAMHAAVPELREALSREHGATGAREHGATGSREQAGTGSREQAAIGSQFVIRVGLHSGLLVAGVVGIKNPRYKLFGDTVNTASRMQSTCEWERTQMSREAATLLPPFFSKTSRGEILVKGKGMMETFYLDGELPGFVDDNPEHLGAADMVNTPSSSTQSELSVNVVGPGAPHAAGPLARPVATSEGVAPQGGPLGPSALDTSPGTLHRAGILPKLEAGGRRSPAVGKLERPATTGEMPALFSGGSGGGGGGGGSGGGGSGGSGVGVSGRSPSISAPSPDVPTGVAASLGRSNSGGRRRSSLPRAATYGSRFTLEAFQSSNAARRALERLLRGPAGATDLAFDEVGLVNRSRGSRDSATPSPGRYALASRLSSLTNDSRVEMDVLNSVIRAPPTVSEPKPDDEEKTAPAAAGEGRVVPVTTEPPGGKRASSRTARSLVGGSARVAPIPTPTTVLEGTTVAAAHASIPVAPRRPGAEVFTRGTRLGSVSEGGEDMGEMSEHNSDVLGTAMGGVAPAAVASQKRSQGGAVDLGWVAAACGQCGKRCGPQAETALRLEVLYEARKRRRWRKFLWRSVVLCIATLVALAGWDALLYTKPSQDGQRHELEVIRYGIMVPVLLSYLALVCTKCFKLPWVEQWVSVGVLVFVGAGIIATSIAGGDPGYGVLALYIVYMMNISIVRFAWRFIIAIVLSVAHLIAVGLVAPQFVSRLWTHATYLAVFSIGQAIPVFAHEYTDRQNYMRNICLRHQRKALQAEQARTTSLLNNLLPPSIVFMLKTRGKTRIAQNFTNVTVLYSDLKEFTVFSAKITPQALVAFLNVMFSAFDRVTDLYGIHKVEIIGDAYFVVGGCPVEVEDHVERCAAAAADMLSVMPLLSGVAHHSVGMRVGLHCGPVMAGVVGLKDPRYHLFGGTVGRAIEMENCGEVGRVHASEEVYHALMKRQHMRLTLSRAHDVIQEPHVPTLVIDESDKFQGIDFVKRNAEGVIPSGAFGQMPATGTPSADGTVATPVVLPQHNVKAMIGIADDNSAPSHDFGVAVSFLYIGNLVFRLLHNVVFSWVQPRRRVYISLGSMGVAMCTLGFAIFIAKSKSLGWVYLAYALGGLGVGTFESNVLSAIAPLGHATKTWAVIGIPIGYNIINVGSFLVMSINQSSVGLQFAQYMAVVFALLVAAYTFCFHIPVHPIKNNADSIKAFTQNATQWRNWAPLIVWHAIALMIDMLCVSLFSGLTLYIYDTNTVTLWSGATIEKDTFMSICNTCTFLGDTISRRISYWARPRHPLPFVFLSVMGAIMCLLREPLLAPVGLGMVFFANGFIYATSTKRIDATVEPQFNLIALSFWLFVGDLGSVTGSNLVSFVKVWL